MHAKQTAKREDTAFLHIEKFPASSFCLGLRSWAGSSLSKPSLARQTLARQRLVQAGEADRMGVGGAEALRAAAARAPLIGLARADRAAVRAAAGDPGAWAAFVADCDAAPVARHVLRELAAAAVDEAVLDGRAALGTPTARAAAAGDDGYEPDPGPLPETECDLSDDGENSSALPLGPDPFGLYLLLDSEALAAALPGESSGVMGRQSLSNSPSPCPSPSPSLGVTAGGGPAGSPSTPQHTPKRPRRRADGGVASARFGEFVHEMHDLCEAAREARSGQGSATRSGAKATKAPSRREAASAANVVEELVGIEAKARAGKYDRRVEDVIAEVSRCIENQSATFSDVLPAVNDKADALREVVGEFGRRAKAFDALRAASVGILGTAGLRAPDDDDDEDDGDDGMKGKFASGEKEADENGADFACSPPALVLDEDGPGVDVEMKDGDDAGGGAAVVANNGCDCTMPEEGCNAETTKSSSDVVMKADESKVDVGKKEAQNSTVMPFPLLSMAHVQATRQYGQLAADAASADTLDGVEAVWHQLETSGSRIANEYLIALTPTMAEFASLGATSCPTHPLPAFRRVKDVLRSSQKQSADGEGTGVVLAAPNATDVASGIATDTGNSLLGKPDDEQPRQLRDPIMSTFEAIGRIRDLRKQIFAFYDDVSQPKGPAVEKAAFDKAQTVKSTTKALTQGNMKRVKVEPVEEGSQKAVGNAARQGGASAFAVRAPSLGADGDVRMSTGTSGSLGGTLARRSGAKLEDKVEDKREFAGYVGSEIVIRNEPLRGGPHSETKFRASDVASMALSSPVDPIAESSRNSADDELCGGPYMWGQARTSAALLLAHGGFAEASDSAINILAELMGDCIERIGRTLSSSRARRGMQPIDVVKRKPRRMAEQAAGLAPSKDSTGSFDADVVDSELGYCPPERATRTREETFELIKLVCSTGCRGGFPELQQYISSDIPRVTLEVRDAEEKVRSKMTEFAELHGSQLPAAADAVGGVNKAPASGQSVAEVPKAFANVAGASADGAVANAIKIEAEEAAGSSGEVAPQSLAATVAENAGGDTIAALTAFNELPLNDAARMFGILTPNVRLDVIPSVEVPRKLIVRALPPTPAVAADADGDVTMGVKENAVVGAQTAPGNG